MSGFIIICQHIPPYGVCYTGGSGAERANDDKSDIPHKSLLNNSKREISDMWSISGMSGTSDMEDKMDKTDNRWVTGRCVPDSDNPTLFYTTVAEGVKWDKSEELVQLVRIDQITTDSANGTIGWQVVEMRLSGNQAHLVLTTPNQEEATGMWMNKAFGVNYF